MRHRADEVFDDYRWSGPGSMTEEVIPAHPVVAPQVDEHQRAVKLMTGQSGHQVLVKGTVWIEEHKPTLRLPPCEDVLADQVFENFGFPAPGPAADVEVLVSE